MKQQTHLNNNIKSAVTMLKLPIVTTILLYLKNNNFHYEKTPSNYPWSEMFFFPNFSKQAYHHLLTESSEGTYFHEHC